MIASQEKLVEICGFILVKSVIYWTDFELISHSSDEEIYVDHNIAITY